MAHLFLAQFTPVLYVSRHRPRDRPESSCESELPEKGRAFSPFHCALGATIVEVSDDPSICRGYRWAGRRRRRDIPDARAGRTPDADGDRYGVGRTRSSGNLVRIRGCAVAAARVGGEVVVNQNLGAGQRHDGQ